MMRINFSVDPGSLEPVSAYALGFVNGEFKLGEHNLPVECAAHLLKGIAEVIQALIFRASVLLQQQFCHRGYLCVKIRKVGQFIGLILVGDPYIADPTHGRTSKHCCSRLDD